MWLIKNLICIFFQMTILQIDMKQWTKIFQYCTCPAGQVTDNFHLSCKSMHLSFKVYVKNISE